ncbi:MAG: C69 family dipeptidase [Armatimonadetes bacterium]|nr:C69 family dipeptidase [Armatimonadota bacterium]
MSYGIYVGKNLTADGSVFLAGYGDEPSSHWLEIVPAREHPPEATMTVGATHAAIYPGELIKIPQAARTAKYITMNYSAYAGFPAPLTNGGLNEYHVAGRDIWSPSRSELREMTPNPQRGPQYSDLSRIAMERARTAREAVEIIGGLIDQYGYTTYGGNSHLFADVNEGWILIEFAGGAGLWAAERLGPDDIRVSRPGYIGDIPLDYRDSPGYRGSPNLVFFAAERGWHNPYSGEPFNVNRIYGDGEMRHEAVAMMEERLAGLRGRIGLREMIAAVRDPELTRDSAGYGQVAHLREGVHPELGVLWVAAATPAAAPFIPYCLGATDIPPEYGWHRYLTEGESSRFMDAERQGIESTRYAFQSCKRLYYLTMEHPDNFCPEVAEALEAFESGLIARQEAVERTALKLYEADEPELARQYLTYYSHTEALNGLHLGETLSQSIEARTKALFGIRKPTG